MVTSNELSLVDAVIRAAQELGALQAQSWWEKEDMIERLENLAQARRALLAALRTYLIEYQMLNATKYVAYAPTLKDAQHLEVLLRMAGYTVTTTLTDADE